MIILSDFLLNTLGLSHISCNDLKRTPIIEMSKDWMKAQFRINGTRLFYHDVFLMK